MPQPPFASFLQVFSIFQEKLFGWNSQSYHHHGFLCSKVCSLSEHQFHSSTFASGQETQCILFQGFSYSLETIYQVLLTLYISYFKKGRESAEKTPLFLLLGFGRVRTVVLSIIATPAFSCLPNSPEGAVIPDLFCFVWFLSGTCILYQIRGVVSSLYCVYFGKTLFLF